MRESVETELSSRFCRVFEAWMKPTVAETSTGQCAVEMFTRDGRGMLVVAPTQVEAVELFLDGLARLGAKQ